MKTIHIRDISLDKLLKIIEGKFEVLQEEILRIQGQKEQLEEQLTNALERIARLEGRAEEE